MDGDRGTRCRHAVNQDVLPLPEGAGNDIIVEKAVVGTSSNSGRVIVAGDGNDIAHLAELRSHKRHAQNGPTNMLQPHGIDTAVGTAGGVNDGTAGSFLTTVGLIDLNHNGNFGNSR